LLQFCEDMANLGKIVVVAALDSTFQRKPFPAVVGLIPLAEYVVKLNAVCMGCMGEASFTKRTSGDTAVEVIGGADKYLATCRTCFFKDGLVPASPRQPLKDVNGQKDDQNENSSPSKRALFQEEQRV